MASFDVFAPVMVQSNSGLPDDFLPDYEHVPEDTPHYSPETFHQALLTYHFRATKKNTWNLVSFEPAVSNTQPSYEVNYRSKPALPLFTRQSDISASRIWPASSGQEGVTITRADFCDAGPLPYCPRARFATDIPAGEGDATTTEMKSRNWRDWTFSHNDRPYVWTLRDIPACIELTCAEPHDADHRLVIARFTYGKVGTRVLAGGEVGHLSIYRDALTESVEGREVAIMGCLVVVKYFDQLGRYYKNDGSGGSGATALVNARAQQDTRVRARFMLF